MRLLFYCLLIAAGAGFYDLSLRTPAGKILHLADFKGKKVLVVNLASASRMAGQLEHLEELQRRFASRVVIIGIPSNSFLNEPLDNAGIGQWISDEHINFPVAEKSVVSGATKIPLYQWLHTDVIGDYQKYLVDEQGRMIGYFSPETDPLNDVVTNAITGN